MVTLVDYLELCLSSSYDVEGGLGTLPTAFGRSLQQCMVTVSSTYQFRGPVGEKSKTSGEKRGAVQGQPNRGVKHTKLYQEQELEHQVSNLRLLEDRERLLWLLCLMVVDGCCV